MQNAEDQLRHVEDSAKQALPTMHGELNELKRALRLQEGMHARTRSELEAARLASQGLFQQASSMPISSRTTAFRPHPDIEGLNDSGHKKLKSIDVKLEVAMTGMLRAGGDKAAELYLEVNRKANDYVRSYEGKIIKGRQIIAMMYESFRTRDRLDMIVSLDYLVKLQCQGDNKLHQFKQTWLEILNRMRQEDIPSEKALRDCLYNKIKDSPAMKWELG